MFVLCYIKWIAASTVVMTILAIHRLYVFVIIFDRYIGIEGTNVYLKLINKQI